MAVSFISTVVFNGNPLIKFDGYFILTDLLQIPNLAQKASNYIKFLFMNRILGVEDIHVSASDKRETYIFAIYGSLAIAYRLILYSGMLVGIYYRFDKFIGILLVIPAGYLFLVRPIWNASKTIIMSRSKVKLQYKGIAIALLGLGCFSVVFFAPWPWASTYCCRVISEEIHKIACPVDTPIETVYVKIGSKVKRNEVLLSFRTAALSTLLDQLGIEKKIVAKEIELLQLDDARRSQLEMKKIEQNKIQDNIDRIEQRLKMAADGIRSPIDGIVTSLESRIKPDYRPGEGSIIGELESTTNQKIVALVPEEDLDKIKQQQVVNIKFPDFHKSGLTLPIHELKKYNERNLNDSPFSSKNGGMIATEARDREEDSPMSAQYSCTVIINGLELPSGITGKFIVPCPPKSLFGRIFDGVIKIYNRETLI